jgi:mycofactocin biosynthesis protein MftB
VDPASAWDLHPQVSVRPEPFGALLYHFGTRKLSFLKDRQLLAVVQSLAGSASLDEACATAGIPEPDRSRYVRAMATLARSQMVVERTAQ